MFKVKRMISLATFITLLLLIAWITYIRAGTLEFNGITM